MTRRQSGDGMRVAVTWWSRHRHVAELGKIRNQLDFSTVHAAEKQFLPCTQFKCLPQLGLLSLEICPLFVLFPAFNTLFFYISSKISNVPLTTAKRDGLLPNQGKDPRLSETTNENPIVLLTDGLDLVNIFYINTSFFQYLYVLKFLKKNYRLFCILIDHFFVSQTLLLLTFFGQLNHLNALNFVTYFSYFLIAKVTKQKLSKFSVLS